mmetsp:Transcript_15049/g.35675  ORF Transcript_15049/g.35675 Transcript_15049/m.35675 type:complete len:229 (+) Transcript_15049:619-1305(+)
MTLDSWLSSNPASSSSSSSSDVPECGVIGSSMSPTAMARTAWTLLSMLFLIKAPISSTCLARPWSSMTTDSFPRASPVSHSITSLPSATSILVIFSMGTRMRHFFQLPVLFAFTSLSNGSSTTRSERTMQKPCTGHPHRPSPSSIRLASVPASASSDASTLPVKGFLCGGNEKRTPTLLTFSRHASSSLPKDSTARDVPRNSRSRSFGFGVTFKRPRAPTAADSSARA